MADKFYGITKHDWNEYKSIQTFMQRLKEGIPAYIKINNAGETIKDETADLLEYEMKKAIDECFSGYETYTFDLCEIRHFRFHWFRENVPDEPIYAMFSQDEVMTISEMEKLLDKWEELKNMSEEDREYLEQLKKANE